MDARQHHLVKSRLRQQTHLACDRRELARLHGAARVWDDAERAEILAAVLDLQERARTMRHSVQRDILKDARLHDIRNCPRHPRIRTQGCLHIVHDARALLRPDHHPHPFECTDLLGRDLRVAARHRNAGSGIRTRCAADQLARLAVAQMRHRARIDNVHIRRRLKRHNLIAACAEQPLHRLRLELVHLAAERHKRSPHIAPPPQIFSYSTT